MSAPGILTGPRWAIRYPARVLLTGVFKNPIQSAISQSRKTVGVLRPLTLSSIPRTNMGTPLEVDKESNSFDERANELATTALPTWLTKITNFIAQWDVETSGLVT